MNSQHHRSQGAIGDDMTGEHKHIRTHRWSAAAVIAVATTVLIVSAAGAADRVVLGEYFTNVY